MIVDHQEKETVKRGGEKKTVPQVNKLTVFKESLNKPKMKTLGPGEWVLKLANNTGSIVPLETHSKFTLIQLFFCGLVSSLTQSTH